jgi:hypothetical protein
MRAIDNANRVKVYKDPQTKKVYGTVWEKDTGELIYFSPRNRKEHFCRKYKGWGISEYIVNDLKTTGVGTIILDIDGLVLYTKLDDFIMSAQKDALGTNEPQLFLPENKWMTDLNGSN